MKDENDNFTVDMLCRSQRIANNAFANAALLQLFQAGDTMANELAEHADEIEAVDSGLASSYLREMAEAWQKARKAMEDSI